MSTEVVKQYFLESKESLVIIKYNAGNIQSVLNALLRLGVQADVTDDAEKIKRAHKVIFPGVGEASSAMNYLRVRKLDEVIRSLQQPVLGICLGMQLLCGHSEENNTDCLNILPLAVKKFNSTTNDNNWAPLKVPQIGWNTIYNLNSELFTAIPEKSYIYNVHSYYVENSEFSIANCNYGLEYAAAVKKDNFYGVQFHTEKSATIGDQILKNFLGIKS